MVKLRSGLVLALFFLTLFGCPSTAEGPAQRMFTLCGIDTNTVIYYSSDGDTWAQATLPPITRSFFGLASDASGHWVAIGYSGYILRSNNGITWTQANDQMSVNYLSDVAFNGSTRWVLVGGDWSGSPVTNCIAFSDDNGLNWTLASSTVTEWIRGVAFGADLWVGVGLDSTFIYSSDGDTWSAGTATDIDMIYVNDVAYNGSDLWVAVGAPPTDRIVHSSDGMSWTKATSPAGSDSLEAVGFSNGTWLAVGAAGEVLSSPDGDSWTLLADADLAGKDFTGVASMDGRWVIISGSGDILYSDNALDWEVAADSGLSGSFGGVAASP